MSVVLRVFHVKSMGTEQRRRNASSARSLSHETSGPKESDIEAPSVSGTSKMPRLFVRVTLLPTETQY